MSNAGESAVATVAATNGLRDALESVLDRTIREASWTRGVAMLDSDVAAFRDALLPVVEAECRRRAAEAVPVLCPKCQGQGVVSRPPWVPADLPTWSQPTTASYRCNLCEGRMVIRTDAIEDRP